MLALSLALAACQGATNQNGQPATGSVLGMSKSAETDWSRHPAHADYKRGLLYLYGDSGPPDGKEAAKWFRVAAEQGHAQAQGFLGRAYEEGIGVRQDYAQAERWYRASAEQGFYLAQASLGMLYLNGRGLPQDDAEAAKWFRRAAEQNYANAQAALGVMYTHGRGVPQHLVIAQMWLRLGARQGNEVALEAMEFYAELITPFQNDEAERRAKEWLEAYHARNAAAE